tara:strand:- start:431 stop:1387 length:957 start_codon:yes stop_codon:yes gene_type:complete
MKTKIKFVYFGSSEFSKIILDGLCSKGYRPLLIITKPDKPKGRGLKVFPTQVSDLASDKKIECLKPASLSDEEFKLTLKEKEADLFIVADYGKIIPSNILSFPNIFSLCAHPSLLPNYRGASPIEYTLLEGDKKTGVTIFKINDRVDAGDIILQKEATISENDNFLSLRKRLAKESVPILIEAIKKITSDDFVLIPQDESKATLTHKLKKSDGLISWGKPAEKIVNLIRATAGWPSAYTYYKSSGLKILSAQALDLENNQSPGVVVKIDKHGIYVATSLGVVKIKELKPQGKKKMSAQAFICGHNLKVGDHFTDKIKL